MIDAMLLAVAQLLAGWLLADLAGGFVHWLEDRILTPGTPLLGAIIAANRRHHTEPLAFLGDGLVARNLATWCVAGTIALLLLLLVGPSLVLLAATVGGVVSSSVHHLAHRPRPDNPILRTLQEVGLIQSAAHHAGHHRTGDRRYCVLTGLVNPVLDSLAIWTMLERALGRAGVRVAGDA